MANSEEKIREYKTEEGVVYWSQTRCIHFAGCVKGLPIVFNPEKRPWIQVENANAEVLKEIILRCPTGALHYKTTLGEIETAPAENTVFVSPDGPLYVKGAISIAYGENTLNDTRMALCRCGASENKPFCDGSHAQVNFRDTGSLSENQLNISPLSKTDLQITATKNGPLVFNGSVSLKAPADSATYIGTSGALCRCGHSSHKPFCDGSHAKVGFHAD